MNLRLPSASAAELTHSSSAASSSGGPMSMLQRAALFEDRVKPVADEDGATSLPDTKWGRCMRADCGYALSPHLYASGQFAGQIRLLCNRFKKVQDGKRKCFFSAPVPKDKWSELPKFMRNKYAELPASLRRNTERDV